MVRFLSRFEEAPLQMAATVLEQVAYQRAVIGIEEPVWHYGKFMGMRRRYSDRILHLLVQRGDLRAGIGRSQQELIRAAEDAAKRAGGAFAQEVVRASREETDNALREKLDGLARRLERQRRAAAVVLADRLRLEGKAP